VAKNRLIRKEQWTDSAFLALKPLTRLFLLALRNESDDNGIIKIDPTQLKIRLVPMDNVNIPEMLEELQKNNHLILYKIKKYEYAIIRNFQKNQYINKPYFGCPPPSKLEEGYTLHSQYRGEPSEKVPGKKTPLRKLENTEIKHLEEWAQEQAQKLNMIWQIDLPLQLAKCKEWGKDKKRTIQTAKTWLLEAQERAQERKGKKTIKTPQKNKKSIVGTPEWKKEREKSGL